MGIFEYKIMPFNRHRILYCIRQGTIGGGESHLMDLIEFIDKTRIEPLVLSFTDGAMIDHFKKKGISTFVLNSQKPFDPKVWKDVTTLINKLQPHLIHIHGTRAFSNLLWSVWNIRIPVVYTVHGWSFNSKQTFLRRNAAILAEHIFTKRADININVSYSNKETGKEAIAGFRSVVIRNGVNLNIFNKEGNYPDLRKQLGIPEDAFLAGFIARITQQKDPLTMIRGFARFAASAPDAYLLMVGDGELKEAAQALARELSVERRVVFEGFRRDIPAVLNCMDVYCLPSLWEGFSIGLLEAMAMGKPVVASAVDGTREVISDGVNGLLIDPCDSAALSESLTKLYQQEGLRNHLRENAFSAITEEFNAERVASKTEEVYTRLLSAYDLIPSNDRRSMMKESFS